MNDRPIRLIDYLIALTKTNTKIVRNLDEYHKVLWLHEIPHEAKYCYTRAWGEEDEHGDYSWIEVKKFSEPSLPRVPDKLKPWVNHETLHRIDDIPELHDSITVEREQRDEQTGEIFNNVEKLELNDFPDIKSLWDVYLDKQWLPWTDVYRRHLSVQKVYAQLFHIYQEQEKLGEQYELVCGVGLLTWRTPTGHASRRHLIVAKASIEFEPHLGKFTVRPSTDGNGVMIELDMLDIDDQPQNAKKLTEDGRESMRDNLWDRASVDPFLTAVANSLADSGQGQYEGSHLAPNNLSASDKPLVEYAPALILRRRSMRDLEALLVNIRAQIEEGIEVPEEFLDLCESLETNRRSEKDDFGIGEESINIAAQQPSEIYFPLPANEEQRQIIRTLDRQRGVLVQGPPGTGKSHTIANLICHLLATGCRVLVTAKTPRALQVLHDKLPDEIKPLCINLLGSGSEERESLEKSVSGILTKIDQRDQINSSHIIARIEKQIGCNREEKADIDAKLMAIRESETYQHSIADGAFKGTAAHIARSIDQHANNYLWFKDRIGPDQALPLSQDEITSLIQDILDFNLEDERELSLYIPDPDTELVTVEDLNELFRKEREAKEKLAANKRLLDTHAGIALLNTGRDRLITLVNTIGQFLSSLEGVEKRNQTWASQAIEEVLGDHDAQWKELLKLTKANIRRLYDFPSHLDTADVSISADIRNKQLLHDAKVILAHFQAGGGTGFWIFKSKSIRDHGSFIDKVKIDGQACSNAETLKKLVDILSRDQILDYIWTLWSGKITRLKGPTPLQVAEIKELTASLESIINLNDQKMTAVKYLSDIKGLSIPSWSDTTHLKEFIDTCFAVLSFIDLQAIRLDLDKVNLSLTTMSSRKNSHPIVEKIIASFNERNIDAYSKLIEHARDLRAKAGRILRKQLTLEELCAVAPQLSNDLLSCSEPRDWSNRLRDLNGAWTWARAKSWLSEFLDADAESMERHSRRMEEDIRKSIALLAAVKAWNFSFSRMDEDDRRHLMAWQQAMKRYGKGTGKHAHTHRRNAQLHLKECRDAVPAWIMPLHRVYETVAPSPGAFDVIIVDEASQCGPEALPLLYLGKRILVVGDDKQISPEAVGINRDQVNRLMRDHLADFKYADSFDVENSLFAHGRIRFGNRITLREHFRCMPEIIQFSNDLCYRADPLIPLRQYPPERLEPLKTAYSRGGYREGSGQRVINRPEAEALVSTVEQCCNDDRYQGMTMGVIVLQAEAQAYLIQEMLLQRIGAEEIAKRRLLCGNPYSFQGDERDVIFLSLVAAPNERIGTLTQEADRRRFNVAASRARDQMWLFHSVTSNHLSDQCFRRRLLDYFTNPSSHISQALGQNADELTEKALRANRQIEKPPVPFDSWFEVDVALDIAGRGYRVVPQYKFADKLIDLVVQGKEAQLAVECDGDKWHGPDEYAADSERQRKLERCGWHFYRIRESYFYAFRDTALDPLWSLLAKMGISPVTDSANECPNESEEATASVDPEDFDTADNDQERNHEETSQAAEDDETEGESEATVEENVKGIPTTIREALRVKSDIVGKAIIEILHERPNNSCVREHMHTFILRRWNIVTRSTPRKQFSAKVDDLIAVMARKGYLTIYKSTNVRIKIGWVEYPGIGAKKKNNTK